MLVQRTPYENRDRALALPLATLLAVSRGYIVVQQDTRGGFASDGEWSPWTHEQADGHDTVRWAAKLPGSSGAVGMFGSSYTGNTSWVAAIDGPPELRAIVPQVTWSEPDDGLFIRGGALGLGLNGFWTLLTGLGDLPRRFTGPRPARAMTMLIADYDGLRERSYWELPAGAGHPADLSTDQRRATKSARHPTNITAGVEAPILNSVGTYPRRSACASTYVRPCGSALSAST